MKITYLDDYHFINESIIPDDQRPVLVKVGVVGFSDLEKFKRMYPESNIIAYEADEDNFANDVAIPGPIPTTKFYNKAVGKSGSITLHRFKSCLGHSVFPRHEYDKNCQFKDSVVVKSVNLEEIFAENGLKKIDVLILNCEGAELDIMEQLTDDSLRNKINQICVSFHDPRIYPTKERARIITLIGNYYHIIRGENHTGGIPDYLMIRKV